MCAHISSFLHAAHLCNLKALFPSRVIDYGYHGHIKCQHVNVKCQHQVDWPATPHIQKHGYKVGIIAICKQGRKVNSALWGLPNQIYIIVYLYC